MRPTNDKNRLVLVSGFLAFLFCSLIVRFYFIQIVEGEKWASTALSQHQCVATMPFMRGSFYSNSGLKKGHPDEAQPLVIDVPKFHLYIDPASIPPEMKEKMAHALSLFLPISKQEFYKKSRSRKLAMWLSREERDRIEGWWKGFVKKEKLASNALFFVPQFQRSYPFGSMLGAVLHTVQEDQVHPTGGLEMYLNSYLSGKEGKRLIIRSPRHPLGTGKVLEAPENGADVYLTINHYLQAIAESELAKGVQVAGAKGGWAVMLDPHTGEIWALAQTPSFDPARYNEYFNDPELIDRTKVRAVTDCFEPGSIFKALTIAVCLKANEELIAAGKRPIFNESEKLATSNGMFPGRSKPLKDGRRHNFLNMEMAIQKSSNIYMARLVQRVVETMGESWYRKTLHELFGVGKKTKVDLPAEASGMLPTIGKLHPNGTLEWSLSTPYSMAIGYNMLVTSLQIAKVYAIFANGGFDVEPHLIRKIVKSGKAIVDKTGTLPKRRVISEAIAKKLCRSLKFTTKEGGTSKRADVPYYTEAGKSGTAEKIINGAYSKENHIASFVGFAPATNPRFVLIVSLDDPEKKFIPGYGGQQFGGVSAAPIFREIAQKTLQYLGVAPDDPEKRDFQKEVADLKMLYEEWNR